MALKNLNADLEKIFNQIIGTAGNESKAKNKYRKFFQKFGHIFEIKYEDAVDQLNDIRTSSKSTRRNKKTGKVTQVYSTDEYGAEENILNTEKGRMGKSGEKYTSGEMQKAVKATAKSLLAEYAAIGTKFQGQFKKPYVISSDPKLVEIGVDLEKAGDADAYDVLLKEKKRIANKVFGPGGEGEALYDILLRAGRVKSESGVVAPSNLYNIGHTDAIGQYKGTALSKGVDAALGEDDSGVIDDVKDTIAKKVKSTLDQNGITIFAEDDFFVFEGVKMVQNPKSKFVVKTSLESQYNNQIKDNKEAGVGTAKDASKSSTVLSELVKDIQDIIKEQLNKRGGRNAKEWAARQGSDSFMDALGKGIVMSPSLLPLYKSGQAKNLTKWKGAKKNRKSTSKKFRDTKSKVSRTRHNLLKAGLSNPKSKSRKASPERGTPGASNENQVQAAFVTRAFINSRLAKQVQKNMGRPGLENQTGRLAESAQVVNAVPKGNQLHMDYTYNPLYRVFENGRQYTSSYDPRPLIEGSIRELAAAKLETKFTLRRV
jgi:hypothetical protein